MVGNAFSYAVTLAVGLVLGVVLGTVARRKRPFRQPSHAQVCGDLKLIHDLQKEDQRAAEKRGDKAAAAEAKENADFTREWAGRGGCSWAGGQN